MFNLFNIGNTPKPVPAQPQIRRIVKPKPVQVAAPKIDAVKAIESILEEVSGLNNPKVDTLRKLLIALENGSDMKGVIEFCREPKKAKKKKGFAL